LLIADNKQILHFEIQNSNDKDMIFRMLRYYVDIKNIYKTLPVNQYLIYIGKEKFNMQNKLNCDKINYEYEVIDFKKIDCEYFLKSDSPDGVILAILCDFKDKEPIEVVSEIIKRLKRLDEFRYKKYLMSLEILSENRNLQNLVKKVEEMLNVDITKLPSYELGIEAGINIGLQEGIQKGIQQGMQKGIQKAQIEMAKKALKAGIDIDTIAKITNLDKEFIGNLK
jgi:predicted transposase YdaD